MSPRDTSSFVSLLEEIIAAAGGVDALAIGAQVRAATLRKWRRGEHPTGRLSAPVERVDSWARRNMAGSYPPRERPEGLRGFVTAAPASDGPRPSPLVLEPPPRRAPHSALRRSAMVAGALAVFVGIVFTAMWWQAPQPGPPAQGRIIVVQNKVAFGTSSLVEDRSPSYLAERPVARCANLPGCKLTGTDVKTGDVLLAVCQLQGELLTNANISSPGVKTNPNIAGSALWYGIAWPDGRRGYFSEVYIGPTYRGGLGLPPC